ncbi:MAG: Rpn family recombination-promoting nuclease/putative transposase [Bacilli bacterium]|nr:Rpn family recombination-promoting nuclease/putative transposase [Bacilli bacterium]MBR1818319.1 Rpn family recombination-promoting nuclease/putative transposase [Bacilli bacterium]
MTKIEYPGLLNDILFKQIFSQEKYLRLLLNSCSFLSNYDLKIISKNTQGYLEKIEYAHKAMYSDIIVETEDIIIDIEAQTNFDLEALNKSKAYAHVLSGYQLKSGEHYEKMKPLVQIIFAKKVSNKLKLKKEFLDHFHLVNEELNYYHSDDFHIYLVQVDKEVNEGYNDNEMFKKMVMMMNSNSLEEVKKITKGDEKLMDMATEIEEFLYGKKAMDLFGDRKRYEKMYLEQGRNEGIALGRNEGIYQTQEETAHKMMEKGYSFDEIQEITGLSEKQIKKLKQK